jgi:uncharacterized protein involved in outer membrane biogenesis
MNIRRIGQIAVGVLAVAMAAGYGILASIDVDSYRGRIIQAAEDATGRKVTIAGPLKLKISFSPAVVVEGVKLANAPWAKAPDMLSVGRAEAEIGLFAALTGTVQVNRLVLRDTAIDLVRRKDGSANWEFAPASAGPAMTGPAAPAKTEAKGSGGMPAIAVREVDIRNLALSFDDAQSGQKLTVAVNALQASASSASDPLKLVLDMAYNGLAIGAKGTVGPIEALTQNRPAVVDLGVTLPGVTVTAKGRIGQPMAAKEIDLKLGFDGKSYDQIGKAFGADLAAVPPLAFDGTVKSFGANGYKLEGGVLRLAGQEIKLAASADLSGAKPKVTADVSADVLDLPKLLSGLSQKSAGGSSAAKPAAPAAKGDGKVFPADPLPLDGLFAAEAEAKASFGKLILPSGVVLNQAKVLASLKDGLLNVAPDFGIGGGKLSGRVVLDARPKGGAAGLDVALSGKDITLAQVAGDMGLTKVLSGGPTSLSIGFKGHGRSVRDLMAGLNGDLRVESGKAEFVNAELKKAIGDWAMSGLTMVDPGFATREKTVLSCLVVRVPVKDGLAALGKGVAMETNALNLAVGGSVNLRSEALDLGIDPMPQGGSTGITQTTAGMVRVGGTLGAPSVGLDVVGAGKAALKVGAAVATGGLSLLGDALIGEATNDPHPCLTAKGEAPAKSSAPAKQPSSSPASGIGGAVKGLFGK